MDISYTKYRIYRECPWKYKLLFVDGRRIPLVSKSSFGLSVHRAIETWLRSGDDSLDGLMDALKARWITDGYPDEAAESRWYSKAVRALTRFHDEEQGRRARTIGVEKEFFWPNGRHTVRGMIDRIDQLPDGSYELVDYKTGPQAPTPEQLKADLQLKFYALGADRGLGIRPALLTVDSIIAGKRVSAPGGGFDEEALAADIADAADSIEAGRFGADVRYCPRCDFRLECPYSVSREPLKP